MNIYSAKWVVLTERWVAAYGDTSQLVTDRETGEAFFTARDEHYIREALEARWPKSKVEVTCKFLSVA